jgi:nitroreductase
VANFNESDWKEFVASRRTTRDFLNKEVSDLLIDELLTDAMTAPSWSNTRPYLVGIAKGEKRDRISKELLSRWDAAGRALKGGLAGKVKLLFTRYGLPTSDYKVFRTYPKDLVPRQQKVGAELYGQGTTSSLEPRLSFLSLPTLDLVNTRFQMPVYSCRT